ncbi:uncharacterized protein LOC133139930 isoform X2 [Conger conger]|uniref:uncharacterized protein LOC133139930 isoform X2 n=1 Tax=Conger conger TaxID=82655 RepID=UPI002A5AC74F|nr:uncharacterized protein LOC133139930 isoform X2 [Conger conger]
MDNKREQEVQGEKSEAEGYPVQEIGIERPKPWSGPSHSCPEPAVALATDEEELTKADIQDEDLTVVGTTKETEEVEAAETEAEAEEEKGEAEEEEEEAEAEETEGEEVESGVQEAPENSQSEPGSQPSPLEGTEVLQTEVMLPATPTDGTAGQEKVSSRKRQNAKPGDPANTQRTPPSFRLQDFSFKIATRYYIAFLFLLLVSPVNSNLIPARTTSTSAHPHTHGYIGSGGKCVLCRDPQCAAHRLKICIDDNCTWLDRTLGIKNCSKDNLKPDEPCQLTDGSLVVQSDQLITFEGMKAIPSEIVFCTDLPLEPKSLPGQSMNTTANTTTPDTGPHRAAIWWSVGGVDIRVVSGVLIVIIIVVAAGIVWKYGKRLKRCKRTGLPPDGNGGNEKEKIPLQSHANGSVTQGPGNDGESAV